MVSGTYDLIAKRPRKFGYRFRSSLEFRWAKFLNDCKLQWRYEPVRLTIEGRWYIPDFAFVVGTDLILAEVKPSHSYCEIERYKKAAIDSDCPFAMLVGDPPDLSSAYSHPIDFTRVCFQLHDGMVYEGSIVLFPNDCSLHNNQGDAVKYANHRGENRRT